MRDSGVTFMAKRIVDRSDRPSSVLDQPSGAQGRRRVALVAARVEAERTFWTDACEKSGLSVVQAADLHLPLPQEDNATLLLMDAALAGPEVVARIHEHANLWILTVGPGGADSRAHEYLRAGAGDYVGRPYTNDELVARLERAVGSRSQTVARRLCCGPVVLDYGVQDAFVDGRSVGLLRSEFAVLARLAAEPLRIVPGSALNCEPLHADPDGSSARTHVSRIRRKLGGAAWIVETHGRSGYRLHRDAVWIGFDEQPAKQRGRR